MASFSRILAVELGASAVRLAEVGPDSRGNPSLVGLAEEEIAFDPAKTSDWFGWYAQGLKAAADRLPSKTRDCHLCLGGPAVFARILKVPAADPARVDSMIGFEAQQTVPAIEQALWDYQLLPSPQPGEFEALIMAIKRETVEEMAAAASSAGFRPLGVTLAPAALLNGFLFNYPEVGGCSLVLEIGARATTILLVEGNRIFVRVVPLGGGAVTQAVATDLQESFAGAEILKKAKGFVHPGGAYEDPADAETARISKLARGVLTRLHTEVERSVTFFRSQQGGDRPQQAWLTGGGAQLGYTDLFFREKLKIPVTLFQPFRRVGLSVPAGMEAGLQRFSCWSVVVGAALQALPEAPVRIDVFKSLLRSHSQSKRDAPAILVGALALTLLAFLPGLHGFWQGAKTGEDLSRESQRLEETSRALQELEQKNRLYAAKAQEWETAIQLERDRLRWPRLLEELRKSTPRGLWITGLKVLPEEETAAGEAGAKKLDRPPKLEIAGMFETKSERADAEAVTNFQKALEEGGVLAKVTVLERETPQYVEGKTDQVALRFRLQAEWPIVRSGKSADPGGGL